MEITGRQIVSKGEYASNVSKKVSLTLFGRGTYVLGGFGLASAISLGIALLYLGVARSDGFFFCLSIFLLFGVGSACRMLLKSGRKAMQDARQIDPGIPLTRANTANIPVSSSLVRASVEPMQAQETVLLRAAAEGQETPADELVRASVGQE